MRLLDAVVCVCVCVSLSERYTMIISCIAPAKMSTTSRARVGQSARLVTNAMVAFCVFVCAAGSLVLVGHSRQPTLHW
jgi:hypothetical protein